MLVLALRTSLRCIHHTSIVIPNCATKKATLAIYPVWNFGAASAG